MKQRSMNGLCVKSDSGQILLIVVLSMVVALTVGLSVASRTITNLKISKQNEESERAFQAAEAGVEQAIRAIRQNPSSAAGTSFGFTNNSSVQYAISTTKGKQILLNGGGDVDQDTGLDVWLSSSPDYSSPISGTITFYWGSSGQNCAASSGDSVSPALEVVVLSGAGSGSIINPTYEKYLYDACSRISAATSPTIGATTFLGNTYFYRASIPITRGYIAKVIPLYNSSSMAADSTVDLPVQGSQVDSIGKSGDTVRKVTFFSSFPQLPAEIFPYTLISQ